MKLDDRLPFSFDRKYLAALAIALLGFGALVILGTKTASDIRENGAQVARTRDVQQKISEVHTAMLDLETSHRGYLLTLELPDLDPYEKALTRVGTALGSLAEMTAVRPAQSANFVKLNALIDSKRTELARTIALAQTQGIGAAVVVVRAGDGKAYMDGIRTVLANMALEESRVLTKYEANEKASVDSYRRAAAALAALMAVLLGAIYLLMLREKASRQRADQAEAESMVALEHRVEERTTELEEASRALQLSHASLLESEERYRTLVGWLPEAIFVHRHAKLVYANPAAVELVGAASVQDLVGKPIIDLIHPDFHQGLLQRARIAPEHDTPASKVEGVMVKLDGTSIDVELQVTRIPYGGEPAMLASVRDVTARKKAERELHRSEARLRGIFESATDAILSADETQTIVNVNPAAAKMFHCSIDDMIGSPLERFIPQRYREQHRSDMHDFGENVVNMRHMGRLRDVMGLRADGEEFPVDASISHLTNGMRLYTVIMRDITERRRGEAALRESEASLRRLLTLLPEAVVVNDGNRITFVNDAAQRLFGADEAALLGRSPLELFPPDSIAVEKSRILAFQADALACPSIEEKIVRGDGATRVVETTATLINDSGGSSILAVMRDVTELQQTRAALADSNIDLQRLIAAQDSVQEGERKRIARELHDDLQQTLTAIRINLAVIGKRFTTNPESVAPMLAELDRLASAATVSTRRIVNDLRPQALEDLGLVAALEALAGQFSRRTGITCTFEAQGQAGELAEESPALATCLYRVAQEALNNVLKHAQASTVQLRLAGEKGGRLVLRITDNGVGMDIGERRKPESFGLLGMRERVRAFGGVLRIDSQPGAGTSVEVVLSGGRDAPPLGGAILVSRSGEPSGVVRNDADACGLVPDATGHRPPAAEQH